MLYNLLDILENRHVLKSRNISKDISILRDRNISRVKVVLDVRNIFKRLIFFALIVLNINSIATNEVERVIMQNGKELLNVKGSGKQVFGGGGCTYNNQRWNGNIRVGALNHTMLLGGKHRCSHIGCLKQFGYNEGMVQYCAERFTGYDPFATIGYKKVVTVRYQGKRNAKHVSDSIYLAPGECEQLGGFEVCARIVNHTHQSYMHGGVLGGDGEWQSFNINDYMHQVSSDSFFQDSVINQEFEKLPQLMVFLYRKPGFIDIVLGSVLGTMGNILSTIDTASDAISAIGGNYQFDVGYNVIKANVRDYYPSAVYPIVGQKTIADVCRDRCVDGEKYIRNFRLKACDESVEEMKIDLFQPCERIEMSRQYYCDLYKQNCDLYELNRNYSQSEGYSTTQGQYSEKVCRDYLFKCRDSQKYDICIEKLEERITKLKDTCYDRVNEDMVDYTQTCQDKFSGSNKDGNFSNSLFCRNGTGRDALYSTMSVSTSALQAVLQLFGDNIGEPIAHLGGVIMPLGGGYTMPFFDYSLKTATNFQAFSICYNIDNNGGNSEGNSIENSLSNKRSINCYNSQYENSSMNNVVRVMENKQLFLCSYRSGVNCVMLTGSLPVVSSIHHQWNDYIPVCGRGGVSDNCVNVGHKTSADKVIAIYGKRDKHGIESVRGYQPGVKLIGVNIGEYRDISLNMQNDNDGFNGAGIVAKGDAMINDSYIEAEIIDKEPNKIQVYVDDKLVGRIDRARLIEDIYIKDYFAGTNDSDKNAKMNIGIKQYPNFNMSIDINEKEFNILGYRYYVDYADGFGRQKANLYNPLVATCGNISKKNNNDLFICGEYFNNQEKFLNNNLQKNPNAYFISGLEYNKGFYDRGAEYICLTSAQQDDLDVYVVNRRTNKIVFPQMNELGVIDGKFNMQELHGVCIAALNRFKEDEGEENRVNTANGENGLNVGNSGNADNIQNQVSQVQIGKPFNLNMKMRQLLKGDYDFSNIIGVDTSLKYVIAKLKRPFYQVQMNLGFNIGCVVDLEKSSISAVINEDKYIFKQKNSLHKGQCYKLPDKILTGHEKNNAIWPNVKLGQVAKGVCKFGYIPRHSSALYRLCVMDYNNKLMLMPGSFGCKKVKG